MLIRDPEERSSPQALLCTDLERDPEQIVTWFVRRWSVEVTFQKTRAHLGVETQRRWSDEAITRTIPCLLVLFSIVTLLAARLPARVRKAAQAACYPKAHHLPGCAGQRPPGSLAGAGFGNIPGPSDTARNLASLCRRYGPTPSATLPEWPKSRSGAADVSVDDATFNHLTRSLGQAAAHARGETMPGLRVHIPREVDVAATGGEFVARTPSRTAQPPRRRRWRCGRACS
ncbi:hypothetical protein [Methylobacterium sp. SyP6R]|uniref:hypothetical protein n=1 Tax=Methylobacterium sp. SyP6R TaxID=2718876 RepID=UPI001F1F4B08|nr:hypothetical protein [Methylobacterium sp. SyP6R]MCF4130216.1 hypothetical protein [Methylobacterium sp. SyP6R]